MGQQQLFLVLLVFIIVGIAVVVGIQLFKAEEVAFEEAEYTEIMLETALQAQAWYNKLHQLGGGGHSFRNLDFTQIPCPATMPNRDNQSSSRNSNRQCINDNFTEVMTIEGAADEFVRLRVDLRINGEDYSSILDIYHEDLQWVKQWGDERATSTK